MNEEQRKQVAEMLGIAPEEVSVDAVIAALVESRQANDKAEHEAALVQARERLSKHAERGAVPVASLDAIMDRIEKADSAQARKQLADQNDDSWCLLPDGLVAQKTNGSQREGNDDSQDAESVSGKIGERVAVLVKEDPTLNRVDAYNQAVAELKDDERKAYEAEEIGVADWQRGT